MKNKEKKVPKNNKAVLEGIIKKNDNKLSRLANEIEHFMIGENELRQLTLKKIEDLNDSIQDSMRTLKISPSLSEEKVKKMLEEIAEKEPAISEIIADVKSQLSHFITHLITLRTDEIKEILDLIKKNQNEKLDNLIYRTNQISLEMQPLKTLNFKKIAFKAILFFAQPFIVILLLKFFH